MLGISLRQIHGLRKRVKEEGIKDVLHKLRGRPSSKKIERYRGYD